MELGSDIPSVGMKVDHFEFPRDATITQLRQQVQALPGKPDGYLLAVGGRGHDSIEEVDWQHEVIRPLRHAFGFVTGAVRRLREQGEGGLIIFLLPSAALIPSRVSTVRSVLLRALLGMAEALRAELGSASAINTSIVFHASCEGEAELGRRVSQVFKLAQMYSLSTDIDEQQLREYFSPLLAAIDATSAGPPLPDIGPMAVVYDLNSIGAAHT
ncbi:hypothetical protein ASE49_15860 [Novosphingobium sp. Leaf2]|nr:hypothetical protein ASE49_15860 [Novosphingobium sp. Leaf2]